MSDDSTDLRALQLRFQEYLTDNSDEFIQDIVSTKEALAEHRLGAYYNAYRIRLIDCLATDFKGLQQTPGEEAFEYLILDYLQQYPSEHPSVRWAGKHMVEFLQLSQHQEKSFLSELAAFEWQQGICFDGPDVTQLFTLQEMAAFSPEVWPELCFKFHPTTHWLDLQWNIPAYWSALNESITPPEKQHESIPTRWLMWRKEMSPHWRSLDVSEAWAIESALNGATFAELCEGLLEWIGTDSVAMTAAGYLKQWIYDEIIVSVQRVK